MIVHELLHFKER
ncbi:hypothetical protein I6E84_08905 [Psychrobacter sp. SCQQ22]|nr:hypothetical protein [Psychrobacter sp. SCQQ22]